MELSANSQALAYLVSADSLVFLDLAARQDSVGILAQVA